MYTVIISTHSEQVVHVDDHKREAVERCFLLHEFVVVGKKSRTGAAAAAGAAARAVLPVTAAGARPSRRAVDRRRRAGTATKSVDVEQRRRETDRQVAGRHLQQHNQCKLEMCGNGFQHSHSLPFPSPHSQCYSSKQIKLPIVLFTIYTSCHFQYTSNCNMFLK